MRQPLVYFLHNPQTGLIKIGTTVNYYARLNELQGQQETELNLLGLMEGDIVIETALHLRFARFRLPRKVSGGQPEWFLDMPEIREYISQNTHHNVPQRPGRRSKGLRCTETLRLDREVWQQLRLAKEIMRFDTLSDTIDWLIKNYYPEAYAKARIG